MALLPVYVTWLSHSDFVEQLNDFYLEQHNNYEPNYPLIPKTHKTIQVDEMRVYKLRLLIINEILKSGQFLNLWKKAEVVPLNKVKAPSTFKDLRPISLLFHLGKVTETIIADQIKQELPELEDQYAYTKQRSTTDALVKLTSDTVTALDNKQTVAVQALMLDFSKAFDRMLPDLAVTKLLDLNLWPS